ncbi:MAG: 16S rRNA (adenine(1518)-N(6)/adenine(1519)-N(6))-dimethyltransferase RsmA [Pseudomonadota bacterium]
MSQIDDLSALRDVIARHDIAAKKTLGQNFLLDLNLTSKIARCAGDLSNSDILEIGPGPGGLTRALLAEGARKVIAVERDARCLPALEEISQHYPGRLEVLHEDALKFDPSTLLEGNTKIIANLPYNIATPLLTGWVNGETWPPFYQSLTLMFQREVAQRICAQPGSKHFGRLGVLCGWRTQAHIEFDVPPQAFSPPPKVTSSIVTLIPREEPLDVSCKNLETITRHAFGQRRKMLRSSLKACGGQDLLERAGIEPTLRAEQLTIPQFVSIARQL